MSFDHTILKGTTSKIIEVTIRDSTTGGGKTGIAHTSVTASYVREGGTRTAISLAAGTAGAAYSDGKWAEVDPTNCKGLYQLHLPNAALATGANAVTITLQATGVLDKTLRIALLDADFRNTAWPKLMLSADAIHSGSVETMTTASTTTSFSTTLTVDETWEGRTLIFTSGPNKRLPVKITAASLISGELNFTVETHSGSAMPSIPADNDTFIIV